jgi:hypothetical protein
MKLPQAQKIKNRSFFLMWIYVTITNKFKTPTTAVAVIVYVVCLSNKLQEVHTYWVHSSKTISLFTGYKNKM